MMRLRLLLFSVVVLLLLAAGCSKDSPTVSTTADLHSLALVQRPEFVDTRPQTVIDAHVLRPTEEMERLVASKPPKPNPGGDTDPNPSPAHKYAYIVGISDYEGTANDLQYCDDDAQDMRAYFQSQGFTIRTDVDRSATADAIVAGLQWLVNQAVPGDEIAFYYSGHGNKYGVDGSSIISTDLYYIPHAYVMGIVNSANCTKVLVTLDACKIGDFLSDGNTGSFVATASTGTYSYDAPDLQSGAWTYYFLQGTGQFIYAEDIAPYAESGMTAWASSHRLRVSPAHTDKYTGKMDI
ncbi:MAG: caspase family protein [candidate division Zixibacteria bacterium]|nr:caspase family protein [candidate division Zixibacteria bacterium]